MNQISELNKSLFKTYPNSHNYKDIYDYYFGPPKQTKETIKRDEECKKYVEMLKEKERKKLAIKLCKESDETYTNDTIIDNSKSIYDDKIKEYEYIINNNKLTFNNYKIWEKVEKEHNKKYNK